MSLTFDVEVSHSSHISPRSLVTCEILVPLRRWLKRLEVVDSRAKLHYLHGLMLNSLEVVLSLRCSLHRILQQI